MRVAALSTVLLFGGSCATPGASKPPQPSPPAPWVASGEPRADSVVLWARADGPAELLAWVGGEGDPISLGSVGPATDFAASLHLTGLAPDQEVLIQVRTVRDGQQSPPATLRSRTAPDPESPAPLTLVVGGDLAGQGFCRPLSTGYTIFQAIAESRPDVVVANGDLIYADSACPEVAPDGQPNVPASFRPIQDPSLPWTDGPAVLAELHAHWRYNRADPHLQALMATTPWVAQWDDHEVINDFGGAWDRWWTGDPDRPGYPTLVSQGRAAFDAWNPVVPGAPLHRTLPWGSDVLLILLDGRSFRSPNPEPDGPQKTLLGPEQLAWLIETLTASTATWKIVSSDVPLSVPTGSAPWTVGRDAFAAGTGDARTPPGTEDRSAETGFQRELDALWAAIAEVPGVVFTTTDVHHARILSYPQAGGGEVLEVISGPLRAVPAAPWPLDPTLAPLVLYEEGRLENFAVIQIDGARLRVEIRGADGVTRPGSVVTREALPP